MSTRRLLHAIGFLLLLPLSVFGQGPLLWDRQEDFQGGYDAAEAVALSGRTAVVIGNSTAPQDGPDDHDLVVQALRKTTGAQAWNDQAFLSNCCNESLFLASRQHRVFAVGTRREPGQAISAILVRGYDVPSGALLWENIWSPSPGAIDADHPTDVVAGPTAVVITGYGRNANGNALAFLVRAYDPVSGAVLWDDRVDTDNVDVVASTAAINRNRVFVAGSSSPTSNSSAHDLILRAYDVGSGGVDWEITRAGVNATQLELDAGRLFVAGSNGSATYLAALAAKTGASLWEDGAPLSGSFNDIAATGGRLAAAIQSGAGFAVRVYDAATGAMAWEDHPATPPGFSQAALAVDLNDNAVYVAGHYSQDFGYSELMVRAYDGRTGALAWDDRSHRTNVGGINTVADVALGARRLFVAGFAFTSSLDADFVVRAYDIRPGAVAP
jgi:hypothetical protein